MSSPPRGVAGMHRQRRGLGSDAGYANRCARRTARGNSLWLREGHDVTQQSGAVDGPARDSGSPPSPVRLAGAPLQFSFQQVRESVSSTSAPSLTPSSSGAG